MVLLVFGLLCCNDDVIGCFDLGLGIAIITVPLPSVSPLCVSQAKINIIDLNMDIVFHIIFTGWQFVSKLLVEHE